MVIMIAVIDSNASGTLIGIHNLPEDTEEADLAVALQAEGFGPAHIILDDMSSDVTTMMAALYGTYEWNAGKLETGKEII